MASICAKTTRRENMHAYKKNEPEWKYSKNQSLLALADTQDALKVGYQWAQISMLFLISLIRVLGRCLLGLGYWLFVGPKLIQHISPESLPKELHEFDKLESNKYPQFWLK